MTGMDELSGGAPVPPPSKRMAPNAASERYLDVILQETKRLERAITAAEFQRAHNARYGALPKNRLLNALSRLVLRGLVVKAGGHLRSTHYAHAQHPMPVGTDTDLMRRS